jgi:23S rRNA G2445 N2-methylase RlmL
VDAVREMREDGSRPDVDVIDSDVPLVLVLRGRKVDHGGDDDRGGGGGGGGGRRQQRGYNRNNSNKDDIYERETVTDVDLYRCLHSSGSLHRRGYRRVLDNKSSSGSQVNDDDDNELSSSPIHRAAMKETLAAGLLIEAGWDKLISAAKVDGVGAILVDPMTGSATLATEAALIACDIAPGLSRIGWLPSRGRNQQQHRESGNNNAIIDNDNKHQRPPCTRWKNFDTKGEWQALLTDAINRANLGMEWARSTNNVRILCNERDVRAVHLAKSSIRNAGVDDIISLNVGDCATWDLSAHGGVLKGRTIFVCNPPWGLRLTDDIDESWVSLREFLRREAVGCESWVLSGNKDLTKILRMKKSRSVVLKTADEDLRWLQYHIFQKSEVSEYQQSR